jgi:hypothetical protein
MCIILFREQEIIVSTPSMSPHSPPCPSTPLLPSKNMKYKNTKIQKFKDMTIS